MEAEKAKKGTTIGPSAGEAPFLVLRGLKRRYEVNRADFYALQGVDLAFPRVGFVAILGESGSGKSTLLNLVGGLDTPSEGEIFVDGVSTKDFSARELDEFRNRRVGFVFQSYQAIGHENLLQNVLLPLKARRMQAERGGANRVRKTRGGRIERA